MPACHTWDDDAGSADGEDSPGWRCGALPFSNFSWFATLKNDSGLSSQSLLVGTSRLSCSWRNDY
jgi:hypothetical protein